MRNFHTLVTIEETDIKPEHLSKVFELLENTDMIVNKGTLEGGLWFTVELEADCMIIPFDYQDPDDVPVFQDFGLFLITRSGPPVPFNKYLTSDAWDRIEEEVMDKFYEESSVIDFEEGEYE